MRQCTVRIDAGVNYFGCRCGEEERKRERASKQATRNEHGTCKQPERRNPRSDSKSMRIIVPHTKRWMDVCSCYFKQLPIPRKARDQQATRQPTSLEYALPEQLLQPRRTANLHILKAALYVSVLCSLFSVLLLPTILRSSFVGINGRKLNLNYKLCLKQKKFSSTLLHFYSSTSTINLIRARYYLNSFYFLPSLIFKVY